MGTTMNKSTYEAMIKENIEWLKKQPRTLEREHIIQIVEQSVNFYYPENDALVSVSLPKETFTCTLCGDEMEKGEQCGYEELSCPNYMGK